MELGAGEVAQLYEERLRMLEVADEAGFWCYHKAEHHFTPLDAAPSSTIFLAAASQRTDRIRLGSLVMLLPFYEPCGSSTTARERFEDAFEIVRIGLSDLHRDPGPTVGDDQLTERILESATEQYRRTGSAEHVPRPLRTLQGPRPAFWYPGNVDYAGKRRLHTITGGPPPAVRRAVDIYRAGLEHPEADWNPGVTSPVIGTQAHIYLAATEDDAVARARQAYRAYHRNLTKLWRQYGVSIKDIDPTFGGRFELAMQHNALVAGCPEAAVEHVEVRPMVPDGTTEAQSQIA